VTAATTLCATSYDHVYSNKTLYIQWLKYKFGSPGTLKKFGALLSAEGALRNLFVPLTLCGARERSPAIFRGPGTAFPCVSPYFNHCVYTWSFPAVICLKPKQSNGDEKIQPEPHKTRPKSRLGLPMRRYRSRMDRIGSGRVFGIGALGPRTMTCAHKRRKINVEQPAAVDLEYAIDARWRDDGPPRQTRCQGTRGRICLPVTLQNPSPAPNFIFAKQEAMRFVPF